MIIKESLMKQKLNSPDFEKNAPVQASPTLLFLYYLQVLQFSVFTTILFHF